MKMNRILATGLASLISVFSGQATASPETEFWKWFNANETKLFDFERDQEATFDRLAAEMHKVDGDLSFEFGPKEHGKREFVISAGGIVRAFPKVEMLYAAAPVLPRWTIIKFRPRREPFDIQVADKNVRAAEVFAIVRPEGDKVSLTLMIPGYTTAEHTAYATIGYLFLDQALGEFDVETRVGQIDFQAPSNPMPDARPLRELPAIFDTYFAHRQH